MKNLISNTAFGQYLETLELSNSAYRMLRKNFDLFLLRKLEIWQFVPCKLIEGVWVVLEEPYFDGENDQYYSSAKQEYQKAKERCLFEGIEYVKVEKYSEYFYLIKYNQCIIWISKDILVTVEDMVKYNLELTPTAQKQIGI